MEVNRRAALTRHSQHAPHTHTHMPSRAPACLPHCIHPYARARTCTAAPKHSIFTLRFHAAQPAPALHNPHFPLRTGRRSTPRARTLRVLNVALTACGTQTPPRHAPTATPSQHKCTFLQQHNTSLLLPLHCYPIARTPRHHTRTAQPAWQHAANRTRETPPRTPRTSSTRAQPCTAASTPPPALQSLRANRPAQPTGHWTYGPNQQTKQTKAETPAHTRPPRTPMPNPTVTRPYLPSQSKQTSQASSTKPDCAYVV